MQEHLGRRMIIKYLIFMFSFLMINEILLTHRGNYMKIKVLALFFLFLLNTQFNNSSFAYSNSIDEIRKKGFFNVAMLDSNFDKKNNDISIFKEYFSEYTRKIYGKEIKLKIVFTNSFSKFWENNNLINFDKVDAYFELMTINDFRISKAEPINILKSRNLLICNFRTKTFLKKDIENIIEILKNDKIKYISIGEISKNVLKKYKIPENRVYVPENFNTDALKDLYYRKEKYCGFFDLIDATDYIFKGKLYFAGFLPKSNDLAWWVRKDSPEIFNFVKNFVEFLKESEGLNKIFKNLYGLDLDFYSLLYNKNLCD